MKNKYNRSIIIEEYNKYIRESLISCDKFRINKYLILIAKRRIGKT